MGYYSHRSAKGGFGSFLGKVAGTAVGFITGGPAGAVAGHIKGGQIGGGIQRLVQPKQPAVVQQLPTKRELISGPLSNLPIAGIANWAYNKVTGGGGSVAMTNGQCPVGYHPNKQKGPKGDARTYCVRNRTMNAANGRAIGRAATRIKKASKQYGRVLRILGKKTGKMVPRGRKRA